MSIEYEYKYLWPPIVSALVSLFIQQTSDWHGTYTFDHYYGVQKFHTDKTPRVGGLSIYLALVVAWVLTGNATGGMLGVMLLAGLPGFLSGLIEDLTRKVGVRERLLANIVSGLFACLASGYAIAHIDLPAVDWLLATPVFAIAFTAVAVAGVANAVNIIDGFNGLAGGILIGCITLIGIIAFQVGDVELLRLCILQALAVGGFMLLNFPLGKIFMGDCGAYFMGFCLAWSAVMLPLRNPAVSPWASLVICSYPVIETVFSMLRRIWYHVGTGNPDRKHLHSLIKLNVIRPRFSLLPEWLRNSLVSPLCWAVSLAISLPALWLYRSTSAMMLVFVAGVAVYIIFYLLVSAPCRYHGPR